jgi:D-alanine-D-alanine ligase
MTSSATENFPSAIHPFQRDRSEELEEPPGTFPLSVSVSPTERITSPAELAVTVRQPLGAPGPRTRPLAAEPLTRRVPRARMSVARARVLVLYDLALGLERGRPEDILADETVEEVAIGIAEALRPQVAEVRLVPVWDDLITALRPYSPAEWVVFNLCESLGGRAFTEALVPRDLARLGFRHTGSGYPALRLSSDKAKTKCLARSLGVPTPPFRVFRTFAPRPVDLRYPLIIKPVAEGGSMGIRGESVARTPDELWPKVEYCVRTYRQPALVEEFIVGREINVALWGNGRPEVLPISEIDFRWTEDPLQKIVSFESKWVKDSPEYSGTPGRCPADLTGRERARIESMARSMYSAVRVHGYARVDLRLREGRPFLLEVNANPDLSPDAGFSRSAAAAGYSYPEMVAEILRLSLM